MSESCCGVMPADADTNKYCGGSCGAHPACVVLTNDGQTSSIAVIISSNKIWSSEEGNIFLRSQEG